jgi:hypothetical protein
MTGREGSSWNMSGEVMTLIIVTRLSTSRAMGPTVPETAHRPHKHSITAVSSADTSFTVFLEDSGTAVTRDFLFSYDENCYLLTACPFVTLYMPKLLKEKNKRRS